MTLKKTLQSPIAALVLLVIAILVMTWNVMPVHELYVSDLNELTIVKAEWAEPGLDVSVSGKPLSIGEKRYEKGLGVHANSEISMRVPKGYTHFIAEVGVDDAVGEGHPSSIVFIVKGDDTILYESPIMKIYMDSRRIDVNVEGMETLSLIVNDGKDGANSDHGDWGDARFVQR